MSNLTTTFLEFSQTSPDWMGHVAFSEAACAEWIKKFSVSSYWKPHPGFGKDSRETLEKLNPPFYPEDETIILDPGIDQISQNEPSFINKVISDRLTLEKGMCFATDFRMIWGNRFTGEVAQLMYREVIIVEKRQNSIRIVNKDSKTTEISFLFLNQSVELRSQKENIFLPFDLLFDFFELIVGHNNGT